MANLMLFVLYHNKKKKEKELLVPMTEALNR